MSEEEKVEEKDELKLLKERVTNVDGDSLKFSLHLLIGLLNINEADTSHMKNIQSMLEIAESFKEYNDRKDADKE